MDTHPPLIHRSTRVFRFDPHPLRKQLSIVGESVILVTRNGQPVKEYSEAFKKTVKLLSLGHSSRTDVIVNEIFQQCPFIEECGSLRASLNETIKELRSRTYDQNGLAVAPRRAPDGSYLPRYLDVFDDFDRQNISTSFPLHDEEQADIMKLNHYVEMLYDDITNKVEGLRLISLLTKSNRYLVAVAEHSSASNAIFRILREDCRRNMNLTLYIMSICLDFARIRTFHSFLIRQRLHQQILDILDFELGRCEKWKVQLMKLKEESVRPHEKSARLGQELTEAMATFESRYLLQNSILRLGFEVLHYLSEDFLVANALRHQGVVTSLADALDRSDHVLWETVLWYLKDMSAFVEYVTQMINVDLLGRIEKILKGKVAIPVKVARACFSLLSNLGFHPSLKHDMLKLKLTSNLAKCFPKASFSDAIVKTLYLLSMDTASRSKLSKFGIVETLLAQLVPETEVFEQISRIKGALAVNLAKDEKCAKLIGESFKISILVKHSIKNQDIMGMKIVRNVASTTSSPLINQQAGHIAKAVVEVNSLDFVLECVGTLSCLNVEQVNFPDLLKRNRLVVWLKRQLMNYMNITNIIEISYQLKTAALEVVILLQNICKSEDGARFIVSDGFIDQMLIRLLQEPHTDPQIIQHCVYLFNVCCRHASISKFLVQKTHFPQELMAFALGIGGTLGSQCNATLHRLSEFDESWFDTMMEHEFLTYNEKWTSIVTDEDDSMNANISLNNYNPKFPYREESNSYQSLMAGAQSLYDDDCEDDENRPLTNETGIDLLDDSATDEESMFFPVRSESANNRKRLESGRALTPQQNNFYSYWKQCEADMALSQDWQFFLNS